jgi:outer membrane protein assembly factor BamA
MEFNFIRLHQSMAFRVNPDMYLGFGYFYDAYTKIKDTKLNLNPGEELITSHYAYNTYYRFDTEHYFNSAISAMFVIDKRDNMINAFKGYYLSVGWRGAFVAVGNRNNTNMFNVEWRSFHPVSKTNPRHLVAFWLLGDFTQDGDLPYMILPATAYDQRGRSARGYTQGRFRGPQMVYGEAEYRFPISRCSGVLGGVVFANATTATNQILDLKLFGSVKPGYGVGLRIMADKSSRTNLSIDFGFGDKSVGFYLAASETF